MGLKVGFAPALALIATFGAASPASAGGGDSTAYHLYPTAAIRASRPTPHALSGNGVQTMLYYGGPVLSRAKIVSVIWGPNVNKTTVTGIGGFLGALADSTYFDQFVQYATNLAGVNGHAGTAQKIGRGAYRGQFTITPANGAHKLTDAAIQAELRQQIAAHKLPAADLNTLYMVYFPRSVSISSNGGSCVAFAAYHSASSGTPTPDNLFYGVMPDCGDGFAALTITSSHEIAEATTDAIPTPGSHPAYPQAWNTSKGYEIGDLCEGTRGRLTASGKSFYVQQEFLNSAKKCGTGNYTSP